MNVLRALVGFAGLAVGLVACGAPPDPRATGITALTGSATAGEALYVTHKCGDCHGKQGRGGFGVDLGTEDVHTTPKDELASTIVGGYWFMPSFRNKLTDQDVADVLAFIDTFGR
jgi:mono/diheme cytochrome c family protein